MAVVTAMCKLLLAMAIGFVLFRKGVFNPEINKKLSYLVVTITSPLLTLYSISTVGDGAKSVVLKLFFSGIACYAIFVVAGWLFTKVFRVPKALCGIYMCFMIFSNNAFMGYPVVQSLYGDSAIFYITIFNMPYNMLFYSLALYMLQRDAALEEPSLQRQKFSPKKLVNPGILAALGALLIYFAGIRMPDIFYSCCGFIGNLTPPLSMLLIGSSLAASSLADVRSEKRLLPLAMAMRLAVIPVIVWVFLHLVLEDTTLINICTIGAAMPVGSLVAMGAAPYARQSKVANIGVALSTVLSILTIPIAALLLGA